MEGLTITFCASFGKGFFFLIAIKGSLFCLCTMKREVAISTRRTGNCEQSILRDGQKNEKVASFNFRTVKKFPNLNSFHQNTKIPAKKEPIKVCPKFFSWLEQKKSLTIFSLSKSWLLASLRNFKSFARGPSIFSISFSQEASIYLSKWTPKITGSRKLFSSSSSLKPDAPDTKVTCFLQCQKTMTLLRQVDSHPVRQHLLCTRLVNTL